MSISPAETPSLRFFHAGPAPRTAGPRPGGLNDGLLLYPGMRVGLFGGSFNPAHDGHAHVAETALCRLGLDRVVWLVSPQNPLKSDAETAPLAERMASAREWADRADGARHMVISDFESRVGTTRTIDTLRALTARYPGVKFVWLMGSDNLASFHRWRGWTDLLSLMPMAVVARPGSLLESRSAPAALRYRQYRIQAHEAHTLADRQAPAWVYLTAPLNRTSSTALRAEAASTRQ